MFANIIELTNIENITMYLGAQETKQTLIIWDVDNTLVEPEGTIGGSPWFEYTLQQKISNGIEYQVAFKEMLELCIALQHQIKLMPVEVTTASIVQQTQATGAHVIALTSRALEQAQRTIEQLNQHGIDFNSSDLPFSENINTAQPSYLHQNGIIFCQTYNKAKALIEIIHLLDYHPTKVIFIDDMLKNLKALETTLYDFDPTIEFIGIRYAYLDTKMTSFDPINAQAEFARMQKQINI